MMTIAKNNKFVENHVFVAKEWCYPLFIRNLRLGELLEKYVHGRVLDYGCAGGKRFKELSNFSSERIVAFDLLIDPDAISNRGNHVMLIQADGRKLPFKKNSFDVILVNHVIEHIDDTDPVFREIYRVLSRGGKLILGIPTFSSITFYVYYPFAYIIYYLAIIISKKAKEGGDKLSHGKRMALVGDKHVLKVTRLFENVLINVPTNFLKTVIFSWTFTLWGALFNHRDHRQKHTVLWWGRKLRQAGFCIEKEISVGYLPLFITNFLPRFLFQKLARFETLFQEKSFLKWMAKLSRDHFLVVTNKHEN